MGKNFRETLQEQMQDPIFAKEWEETEVEYQLMKALLAGREEKNMTQKELADKTGITQSDISKLENGNANPSLQTLKRLAAGLDMMVKLEFVPVGKGK